MKLKTSIRLFIILLISLFFVKDVRGQTIVDSLTVKPETEITLDFYYDLPNGAAFNDVYSFSGEIKWPSTNGYALIYIPSSLEFAPAWNDFLNVSNEGNIEFHNLQIASAGAFPVRVDRDTTIVSMTFITPTTFDLVEIVAIGFFKFNESPTEYTHEYIITVDPNLGTGNDSLKEPELNYTATLFPNPAVDGVNIQLEIDLPLLMAVDLYDVTGKLVKNIHRGYVNSNQLLSFSVYDISAGTYFIVLRTKYNKLTLTLIVQR